MYVHIHTASSADERSVSENSYLDIPHSQAARPHANAHSPTEADLESIT